MPFFFDNLSYHGSEKASLHDHRESRHAPLQPNEGYISFGSR